VTIYRLGLAGKYHYQAISLDGGLAGLLSFADGLGGGFPLSLSRHREHLVSIAAETSSRFTLPIP